MEQNRKTIGVSGASGFIGGHLTKWLKNSGYNVIPIDRRVINGNSALLESLIAYCDVVINLAGAPISKRWSKAYKTLLRSSRIDITRKLVGAINATKRTRLLISTSAVGRYPADGICHDETENIEPDTFLSNLCNDWENEARNVRPTTRLAITLSVWC